MAVLNINEADQKELTALENVGPVLAERIMEYRENEGQFKKLKDLKNVKGIGAKLYSDIKDENELELSSLPESEIEEEEEQAPQRSNIELNIPEVNRVENAEESAFQKPDKIKTASGKSRANHCPALRSCSVYKEEYCENNYEACARYKIISSPLSSEHISGVLLPDEDKRAETILETNL
ncbi:MAG: ComEA family DNA-binding protein [Bacillota bacterium]